MATSGPGLSARTFSSNFLSSATIGARSLRTVADTRETYIDRRGFRGASHLPQESPHWTWNVLIFPIKLHDDRDGAVLTARLIEKK